MWGMSEPDVGRLDRLRSWAKGSKGGSEAAISAGGRERLGECRYEVRHLVACSLQLPCCTASRPIEGGCRQIPRSVSLLGRVRGIMYTSPRPRPSSPREGGRMRRCTGKSLTGHCVSCRGYVSLEGNPRIDSVF